MASAKQHLFIMFLAGIQFCVHPVSGGDFSQWRYKMKIAFSGYNRLATLTNFPVLVVVGTNIPGFAYDKFGAPSNGADLRFADSTETNELNYETETWNTNGDSSIWVQVPEISGTNTCVWAYFGRRGLDSPPAYTTNFATWSGSGYLAVWHLSSRYGANAADSSGLTNNGELFNMVDSDWTNGQVSGALSFKDANDRLQVADSPSWAVSNSITLEMWISPKLSAYPTWETLYGDWYDVNYMSTHMSLNNGRLALFACGNGTMANYDSLTGSTVLPTNQWSHVAGIFDAGRFNVFLNGSPDAVEKSSVVTNLFDSAWRKTVGVKNDAVYSYPFTGVMDEVRISNVSRSSNWIWACWMNQASNSVFNDYGAVLTVPDAGIVMIIR